MRQPVAHHTAPAAAASMAPEANWPQAGALILNLDAHGIPLRWIDWQHACFYHARDLVAWSAGEHCIVLHGGTNRLSGERSTIVARSIIATKGRAHGSRSLHAVPPLTNRELFLRDHMLCAYCGAHGHGPQRLTRDHIVPLSRGGHDHWMNVVTACRACNQRKGGRTPQDAGMELLYAPYVPNKAEYLILCNRHILADQMGFLAPHLSPRSRAAQGMQWN